jgi:hypothetical protein
LKKTSKVLNQSYISILILDLIQGKFGQEGYKA